MRHDNHNITRDSHYGRIRIGGRIPWWQGDHHMRSKYGESRRGMGGRGEGSGKRRFFERGEFKYALLELLDSKPMHGYQLIKAMEDKTGGLYVPSAGSIYPNLQLLEDMGLISVKEENDGKKMHYITDKGRTFLQERQSKNQEHWEREDWRPRNDYREQDELRDMMKEWSEIIRLIARAAKESSSTPEQSSAFREIMQNLQLELTGWLDKEAHSRSEQNREEIQVEAGGWQYDK